MNLESRIETLTEKKLIGKKMIMSFSQNTTAELWGSFMPRRKEIQNNIGTDLYSIQIYEPLFFEKFDLNKKFEKWATIEVTSFEVVPDGMQTFTLPGGLYAVFLYRGDAGDASPTFQYIFGTWLAEHGYFLDTRPHFEILGEKYLKNDPDSEEEIWIPIKMKVL